MRRNVIEAIIKRLNAIDIGGINSTAISTSTKEKLHKITIRVNNKYINNILKKRIKQYFIFARIYYIRKLFTVIIFFEL